MNTTSITNQVTGTITTTTIIHHGYSHHLGLAIAILAAAVLAWTLRKLFWSKDSN